MATTRCAPDHRPFATDPERHHELGTHAAWYVVAGIVTTGVQALLFLLLRDRLGSQVANLVAIALTTVGNTEFHRRVTFAGRHSNAGKRHLQDLLTFAFYAGYGSAVLAILDAVVDRPTSWEETGTLLLSSLVGGFVRFAVLRWWVFAHGSEQAEQAEAAHTG